MKSQSWRSPSPSTPSRRQSKSATITTSRPSPVRCSGSLLGPSGTGGALGRSAFRSAVIPTVTQALSLQKQALRILQTPTMQASLDAENILNEAQQVISRCSEPNHPALADLSSSCREICKFHGLGEYRRSLSLSPTSTSLRRSLSNSSPATSPIHSGSLLEGRTIIPSTLSPTINYHTTTDNHKNKASQSPTPNTAGSIKNVPPNSTAQAFAMSLPSPPSVGQDHTNVQNNTSGCRAIGSPTTGTISSQSTDNQVVSCTSPTSTEKDISNGGLNIIRVDPVGRAISKRWDALIGLDEAKLRLREVVALQSRFLHLISNDESTDVLNGALLYGPPGTGKTSLVKAAAYHFGWNAILLSAGDILSKYCGESEQKLRLAFKQARILRPCILFVDEIDSLGQTRTSETTALSRRILTELMILLSHAASNDDLTNGGSGSGLEGSVKPPPFLFIAATNEPWALDPALLRRLPHKIYTPYLKSDEVLRLLNSKLPRLFGTRDCTGCRHLSHRNCDDLIRICETLSLYSPSEICEIIYDSSKAPLREALSQGVRFCSLALPNELPCIRVHSERCTDCCELLEADLKLEDLSYPERLQLRSVCWCDIDKSAATKISSISSRDERYQMWAAKR